jgi:peptide/nickel transport system permease protein
LGAAEASLVTRYIIRRLIHSVIIVWGVATLVFFLLRAIPGDPVLNMLGPEYTPEAADALRDKLGLDEAVLVQFVRWLGDILVGDLGTSITGAETVGSAIASGLPKTLSISVVAFIISLMIAVPAGILSALRRNSLLDFLVSTFAFLGVSMPSFWFGIILILIFAVNLGWLPSLGYASLTEDGFVEWFKHLLLPALAIGPGYAAILTRFIRAGLLEAMSSDYIRTARAKGLSERRVVMAHGLRNSMIPVVTVAGIQVALLLSGTVVIETVFSIRGIGRLLVGAIFDKDYPMVQGAILVVAVIFVMANLIVDILYTLLDPRIRYA